MLEKLFIGTFILTLLAALLLGLVVASENTTNDQNTVPSYDSSFKIYSVDQGVSLQEQLGDENDTYLQHLIRKLRRDVKAIPAVTAPGY